MKRKIILNNKEYTMPKMSVDTYMEYLELSEKIDGKPRYTKQDIEAMMLFTCKAYGNQFTGRRFERCRKRTGCSRNHHGVSVYRRGCR